MRRDMPTSWKKSFRLLGGLLEGGVLWGGELPKSSPPAFSESYSLPPLALLRRAEGNTGKVSLSTKWLEAQAQALHQVLEDFGIRGRIVGVNPGPVVTLYELEPAAGLKSSRVIGLADDIARSMSAISARVAIVPGRNIIGIVLLRELLEPLEEKTSSEKLALALGKDISGKVVIADLARMPHLLVAGTTGSGKSVGINAMILSLVYRLPPERCRFIMIDPKRLELSVYDGIPHLLTPVVTDPKKAVVALKWTVREMENRYRAMSQLGVRSIEGYNQRVLEALSKEEALKRTVQVGFDETGKPFLRSSPSNFTLSLLLSPSVDVITGTIKANFPTRISFQVTSKIDSNTILGEQGAEQLLGQGDMLYMAAGGRIVRVHGPFVSDQEVEKVVGFLKIQGEPSYATDLLEAFEGSDKEAPWGDTAEEGQDNLYRQAVEVVLRHQKASTSFVQRQLQIGYNRAARLIERMENEGIISPANHSGKRELLSGASGEKHYVPLEIVSVNGTVYVANHKTQTLETHPLSSTPLFVLLRPEIRLGDLAIEKELKEEDGLIYWTLTKEEDTGGEQPEITLIFKRGSLDFQGWAHLKADRQGLHLKKVLREHLRLLKGFGMAESYLCGRGGTGRRAALRSLWRRLRGIWGFFL
ncbi:hypothetical protein DAPPUDRAFT_239451 [Daphnia pulex]|uniref:FtsK domain-containing protein n=1 Tax=Daphnia pulex TaxID=6669 RepID=E9G9D6_DAPPU|nr:hypothetical protein DAPPUDRAFT_239451 [Daphnia pulex]|eukprot:EFX83896.1 hypothetical protein DAPPUDRAFT_239451 [Daphnia pulex]